MIGTNDVGDNSDLKLFTEYYRQCLLALQISGIRAIYCGHIPPMFPNGHAFFDQDCLRRRELFNDAITEVVANVPIAHIVVFDRLTRDHYEDPVHFNEEGNILIAECFAKMVIER